jgi:hypothetical protein
MAISEVLSPVKLLRLENPAPAVRADFGESLGK